MNYRRFHVGESVRVGRLVADRRLIGAECTVESLVPPLQGEHRYAISSVSGLTSIVFECTLSKVLVKWDDCVWQPRRVL